MKGNYKVYTVDWCNAQEQLLHVRRKVFIEEQGVPETVELDSEDESLLHVLALGEEGNPIGTGRLASDGKIGRVAVLREWRTKGVGKALMHQLISEAESRGLRSLYLHAQTSSVAFYEKLGFRPVGDEFREVDIPHFKMILYS